MRPRILFVVMSAVTPAPTVDQLARALAPHQVLVHHDFGQTPDFRLAAANASFVPEPRRTGWATFGFVEGIFHALAHAVEHCTFDYLQLLSPTCLPIKPLAQFEAHVAGAADAHFGAIDLLADEECLMNVGYRAFTPMDTLRHRALRRLTSHYFAGTAARRDEAGIWLRSGGRDGLRAWVARQALDMVADARIGRHPFTPGLRPYYGSVWFGARPQVVRGLVEDFRQPALREYFRRVRISEEFLVPSLLMRHARHKGPLNHFINRFDEAHPGKLDDADIDILRGVPAFFARKFPEDPQLPVRTRVLRELVDVPAPAAHAPVGADAEPAVPAEQPARQRLPWLTVPAIDAFGRA